MEIPFEDIFLIVASSLGWLALLALLSRFNRRRGRNGLPVNWGGLLLVAAIVGLVTAIGYRAYSNQGEQPPEQAHQMDSEANPGSL